METIQNKNRKQRGVAAIITALCIFVLLGIAAFAVDISTYFLRLNELQNAAEAGALAGARVLYDPVTKLVNTNAKQEAHNVAEENVAQSIPVEVNWTAGQSNDIPDVRIGHWSFSTRQFVPISGTGLVDLFDYTTEELDDPNTGFINAVEVTARRDATPVLSFFAVIFGIENLKMKATAVAYVGFAGSILEYEVDLPIAMCEDSIKFADGNFNCTIGRMINSGSQTGTNDTARFTDFTDTERCSDQSGINSSTMEEVVNLAGNCDGGNPEEIGLGTVMATGQGEFTPIISDIKDCFHLLYENPDDGTYQMWSATLPVIDCSNDTYNNNCSPVVGVAEVYIAWVNDNQDLKFRNVPKFMYGPIDDEGNTVFLNWPGEFPPGNESVPATYENVDRDALASFIQDLYTYYESSEANAFKNLEQELIDLYGESWTLEDIFVDQDVDITDPNGVLLTNEIETDGKARWASFIQYFDLYNVDSDDAGNLITKPAPWRGSSIYFLPDCEVRTDLGGTGGKNFGILAKTPVLVN